MGKLHYILLLLKEYSPAVLSSSSMWVHSINPLPPELFFFSSFFGTKPKIDSFRLPTHSRDAHRKFFDDPFLN